MDENTKKQIEHLSKVFGGDKMVSASDIAEVLKGLKSILDTYKKDTAELNQETREMVENAIDNIKAKYDELVAFADEDISTKKGKLSEESTTIKEQISNELETLNRKIGEVENFLKEVKAIKVQKGKDGKDGLNGKDGISVNKDEVISEILENIKLPEYELFNLEEKGEQIVTEINALPLEDEYKIDASHIKNLPKSKASTAGPHYLPGDNITIEGNVISATGGGSALTVQDIDGNPTATNVNTIKFTNGSVTDDGAGVVTVTTGSGGGGDVSSNTATSVDSEVVLFSGTGGKTIKRATSTGIAKLTSGVLSAITLGSGVETFLTTPSSANLATAVTDETGSGALVFGTDPTFTTRINTPEIKATTSAGFDVHSNAGTQVALFGAGGGANSTFYGGVKMDYATATTVPYFDASKNLISSAVTPTELGYVSGVTSAIQTQLNAKQATITFGTGVQTALGVNVGSAGAPVLFNGALGTPSSGVATNLTGTASGLTAGTVTTNANLSGDVTSVGNATTIASGAVDIAMLSATGTPSASTYLRGDNTWATVTGSGDVSKVGTPVNNQVGVWTGDGTIEGDANLTFDTATDLLSTVNATLTGELTLPNTGLHILDTNGTHDLIVAPGSNLTADRTLTVTTGDTNMILDLTAVTDEYVLAYDSGTNTWRGVAGGGGGGSPGGSNTQVQFNASGSFDGDAFFTYDDTNRMVITGGGTITGYTPASTTDSIFAVKSTTSYFAGLSSQNTSAGTTASNDIIAYDDTGLNYIDMGIASSGNTDALFTSGGASTSYLYGYGQLMTIGTATANKSLQFITGGTLTANIRLTIDGTGLMTHTTAGTTSTQFTGTYNSVTTGIGQLITANALTSGSAFSVTSSSSAGVTGMKGINVALTGANNGATQSTYGGYFSNTRTGTTSVNTALYATTSGANLITDVPLEIRGHQGGGLRFGNTSSTQGAIWPGDVTPTTNNFALNTTNGGNFTDINSAANVRFSIGNSVKAKVNSTGLGVGSNATPSAQIHVVTASTSAASTGQLKFTTGTLMTTAEAGAFEYVTPSLYFTNGSAVRQEIPLIQQSRVSTQFDKTSDTTLANVTGLTASLNSGKFYKFKATLYTTANVAGGVKVAIAGTATATTVIYEGLTMDAGVVTQTRATALGTAVGAITTATAGFIEVTGYIQTNASGTLTVQFAQNASNGTASSVLVGSDFQVQEIR